MAYNPALATATTMAPQLGTLSGSTTPTSTAATVIWDRVYDRVRSALLGAGISPTVTGGTITAGWVQRVEMLLTSGEILLAKGSIGTGSESTAPTLIKMGEDMLAELPALRMTLIANGGAASTGSVDERVGSHWLRAKDPDWDATPGEADVPYAAVPVFPDGSDL